MRFHELWREPLTDSQWSTCVAMFCIGALFGALFAGWLSDRYGRKMSFMLNNVLFVGAGVALYFTNGFWMLFCGRVVIGLACGGTTVVVPTYLGEISPANLRGAIGTLNQLMIVTGILVSTVLGGPMFLGVDCPGDKKDWAQTCGKGSPHDERWRTLFALTILPASAQILTAWTIPESPKWLFSKLRIEEGKRILRKLRGVDDVELEANIILDAAMIVVPPPRNIPANSSYECEYQVLSDKESRVHRAPPVSSSWRAIYKERNIRRALVIAVTLNVLQQFSGINSVFYYSSSFFASAGVSNAWLGSTVVAAANAGSVFIAVALMDKAGRRVLLFWSFSGMAVSTLLVTLSLFYQNEGQFWGIFCVICTVMYVAFFEVGLGPIPWLIVAEVTPTSHRALIMSIASGMNWFCNFIIAESFPLMAKGSTKNYVELPFTAVCLLGIWFVWRVVPETKGKEVAEIQKLLMSGESRATSSTNSAHINKPTKDLK